MTMQALPATRSTQLPGLLSGPFKAFSVTLTAWRLRRKQKADMALLIGMEPHMLNDIGVSVVHTPYDGGALLSFHPATLATTMNPGRGAPEHTDY